MYDEPLPCMVNRNCHMRGLVERYMVAPQPKWEASQLQGRGSRRQEQQEAESGAAASQSGTEQGLIPEQTRLNVMLKTAECICKIL